ncbi:hypothetical protein AGMMS50268_14250 [Spirochaetia bacterium]|nr:hypothetical protein AGMMS50268_14250 [Spirochaetia bacterium]
MKKLAPASMALILTFLMVSCPQDEPGDVSGNFWAQNLSTGKYYQVDAIRLAEGRKCLIWAEKSAGVSAETAEQIAREYDDNIYQKMLDTFGITGNFTFEGKVVAHDTLELADWLGNGDGKLAILLLDIKDDYTPGKGYVAGYFWAGNFFQDPLPQGYRSNKMDMMYVDINPGVPGSPQSNATFAHELQHLMNYTNSQLSATRKGSSMDTWIDEGLATAAEYVYLKGHDTSRINWFNKDQAGTIAQGNNFFVWGNHTEENSNAILDDYATAYLFFQWLRIQSPKGIGIYKDIISSTYVDYRAVTTAAGGQSWSTLLGNWLKANYRNDSSGVEGYKGELTARVWAIGGGLKTLYPGEGVYSKDSSTPLNTGNVRFAQITRSTAVTGLPPAYLTGYTGDRVLMYNVNLVKNDTNPDLSTKETGTLPGTAETKPPLSSLSVRGAFNMAEAPFAIDARDMLRRHGHEGWESANVRDLPGVQIDVAK